MHFITSNIQTHALEVSILDPTTHLLTQKSVNMSLSDWFVCKELVTYSKDNNSTLFHTNAEFTLSKALSKMKTQFINEFTKNTENGKIALEQALAAKCAFKSINQ